MPDFRLDLYYILLNTKNVTQNEKNIQETLNPISMFNFKTNRRYLLSLLIFLFIVTAFLPGCKKQIDQTINTVSFRNFTIDKSGCGHPPPPIFLS